MVDLGELWKLDAESLDCAPLRRTSAAVLGELMTGDCVEPTGRLGGGRSPEFPSRQKCLGEGLGSQVESEFRLEYPPSEKGQQRSGVLLIEAGEALSAL
jgi:hypothetical protein